MNHLIPGKSPSVGSLVKKIIAINPNLSTQEIIDVVRRSTRKQGPTGDYALLESVDEEKALNLAAQHHKHQKNRHSID